MGFIRRLLFYLSTEKQFRTEVQKDMTKCEVRLQNLEKHIDAQMNLIREQRALVESLYTVAHKHEVHGEPNEDSRKEVEGNEVEGSEY